MKDFRSRTPVPFGLVLLLALGWFTGGCASSPGDSSAPKPGRGIAEYRALADEARRAVAATVQSLDALAQPHAPASAPHPALPDFDRALHQLELTSIKTRARAEAIIARGQAYFDEWKEQLAANTDPAAARGETGRYARLFEHFERVRERSGDVRAEFRPFMAKLREFRAALDTSPNSSGSESSRGAIDALSVSGRRVLDALDSVSRALDDAEAELHAARASKQ